MLTNHSRRSQITADHSVCRARGGIHLAPGTRRYFQHYPGTTHHRHSLPVITRGLAHQRPRGSHPGSTRIRGAHAGPYTMDIPQDIHSPILKDRSALVQPIPLGHVVDWSLLAKVSKRKGQLRLEGQFNVNERLTALHRYSLLIT
jgi:hypothetical protein